ncbi:MAG: YcaO-like family protein [Halobacteria archaeon]|nr:YcaO-like family protein [Halobacteria archaeon]
MAQEEKERHEISVVGGDEIAKALDWLDAEVRISDLDDAFRETADLVISEESLDETNKRSVESRTPSLGVEFGGEVCEKTGAAAAIGPLVHPGSSACRTCLRLRIEGLRDGEEEKACGCGDTSEDHAGGCGSHATPTVPDEAYTSFAEGFAALETGRYFSTAGAETIGGVCLIGAGDDEPFEVHTTARVPFCPDCWTGRPIAGVAPRDSPPSDLDSALDRAEAVLDDVTGILGAAAELPSDETGVPYYVVEIADTPFSDASSPDVAAGVSVDWQKALMKAMGEGLERYSAAVYRHDEFENATYDAMVDEGRDPIDPADLALFSDGQYDDVPYTDPSSSPVIEWTPGYSLTRDDGVAVPAEFVYFPFDSEFAPGITTGLALGSTQTEAIKSGLLEVIERDACMKTWLEDRRPEKIEFDVTDLGTETSELVSRVRSAGIDIHASYLTAEIDVPVVGVALTSDEYPRFAVAAGASLDPEEAFRSALEEAVQSRREVKQSDVEVEDADEISTSEEHVAYAADRPGSVERFVSETDGALGLDEIGMGGDVPQKPLDKLDAVRERVEDAGYEVIASNITSPDVTSIGFDAVRVVVPRAQPLHFGLDMRRLGGDVDVSNPDPHPFP